MKASAIFKVMSISLLLLGINVSAYADSSPTDNAALQGVPDVKIIFDVTTGDAKKLLSRLGLVEETRESITKQGAKAHIILSVRGPASLLVQKDESRIKLEDLAVAAKIKEKIRAMSKEPEYQLNQCAVANRYLKINNDDTMPEIKVIGNSWISLAAYQNKGYAYIPID